MLTRESVASVRKSSFKFHAPLIKKTETAADNEPAPVVVEILDIPPLPEK
jgi:hypothetical protein